MMREARREKPDLFPYLSELNIDILKYDIDDAANKTPEQRRRERVGRSTQEIPDLAQRMGLIQKRVNTSNPDLINPGLNRTGLKGEPRPASDTVVEKIAEGLSHLATTCPPPAFIDSFHASGDYSEISTDRFRFGISVANEAINVHLVSELIAVKQTASQISDQMHRKFLACQDRRAVVVGDIVVTESELGLVARESGRRVNSKRDAKALRTDWSSLMNILYFERQHRYARILQVSTNTPRSGVAIAIHALAMHLAEDLTGEKSSSSGERFRHLLAGVEGVLLLYEKLTRDFIVTTSKK